MLEVLHGYWVIIFGLATALAACGASVHAVLRKRETRAIIAWVGLIWLAPLVGTVLYITLGINRIERRARALRSDDSLAAAATSHDSVEGPVEKLGPANAHLAEMARLVGSLTGKPLLAGNRVTPLVCGDEAYPQMLEAIAGAEQSVGLMTYIFDVDRVGRKFLAELTAAKERGVQVRVLIDDVGSRYSRPTMLRELQRAGVRAAAFLPTRVPRLFHYANLRNHRKVLVVDGKTGFAGGMNLREGHQLSLQPGHPICDLHFKIEGPVVSHLREAFAIDWEFASGERLEGDGWCPPLAGPAGDVLARGVPDGPDENFELLRMTILGALATAKRTVAVVTPYFLPDTTLITALNVAALRGVDIDIVLPEVNNLPYVHWAAMGQLGMVLERGCRVWFSPPPFDHTKIMVVDQVWSLLGSSNWDPRSLRLNFEFNVECYDAALGAALSRLVAEKIASARRVTLDEVNGRSFLVQLRDGVARLGSPYM